VPDLPRLKFRPLEPGRDAAFILRLLNEPGWLAHIGDRDVHTLDAANRYIEQGPLANRAKYGFALDVCELADSATPVGIAGLIKRDWLDVPDLGFAFLVAYEGLGLATEAARTVLNEAHERGFSVIDAITARDNRGSQRVLDKCGFRRLGEVTDPKGGTVLHYRLSVDARV
jgi:[ribosomal protein S5]-alanine N-acetyltransferase